MYTRTKPIRVLAFLFSLMFFLSACEKNDLVKSNKQQSVTEEKTLKTNFKVDSASKLTDSALVLDIVGKKPAISPNNTKEKPLATQTAESKTGTSLETTTMSSGTYGCGAFLNGTYGGSGSYTYSDYSLDLSSAASGATISINVTSYDVPNKFDVYDAASNLVVSSAWMGYATYYGPWGASLNTPQSKTISFSKTSTSYVLRVQTITQGYSDSWEASISCPTPQVSVNGNRLKFPTIAVYEQYADNLLNRNVLINLANSNSSLITMAEQDPNDQNDLYPDFLEQILNQDQIVEIGTFLVKIDLVNSRVLAIKSNTLNAYQTLKNNNLYSSGVINFHLDVSNGLDILQGLENGTITLQNYQTYFEVSDNAIGLHREENNSMEIYSNENRNDINLSGPMAADEIVYNVNDFSPFGCRHAKPNRDENSLVWNTQNGTSACGDNVIAYYVYPTVTYQKAVIYFSLQSKLKSKWGGTCNAVATTPYSANLILNGNAKYVKRCADEKNVSTGLDYTTSNSQLKWRAWEAGRSLSRYDFQVTFGIKHFTSTGSYFLTRQYRITDGY